MVFFSVKELQAAAAALDGAGMGRTGDKIRMLLAGEPCLGLDTGPGAGETVELENLSSQSVVGSMVWTRDDIKNVLEFFGRDGTEEEVDAVVRTGRIQNLFGSGEATWECTEAAVRAAFGNPYPED